MNVMDMKCYIVVQVTAVKMELLDKKLNHIIYSYSWCCQPPGMAILIYISLWYSHETMAIRFHSIES